MTMRAQEFNSQVQSVLEPTLTGVGFKRVGQDFVRERGDAQLVLFRFGNKYSSLCQFTRFMLCFRHVFLRGMDEKVPSSHPKDGHSYPFKIKPSDLAVIPPSEWRYHFELNPRAYDEVEFGQLNDARPVLDKLGELIATKGVEWGESFTVEKAIELLKRPGSNAWCERLWLDDYNGRTGRVS
jgi:hypothetical protein